MLPGRLFLLTTHSAPFGSSFSFYGSWKTGNCGHLRKKELTMQIQLTARCNSIRSTKINKPRLVKAGMLLIGLAVLWTYRIPLQGLLALVKDRESLLDYLNAYGDLGMVLMFILLFVQVIAAAIPGHFIMIAGGYLYGFVAAALIIHTSTVIASQIAYCLARRYGRPVVERLAPAPLVEKWTKRAERQGVIFFIFSFMLPIFPTDVMNFVAGLSGLSFRKFLAANFIGRLPSSILFALIGAQGLWISPVLLVVAVVFTIAAFALWRKVGQQFEQG
jgi:uncharacterized membrane protein YdjX (TVP38/TMEM64 family)